MLVDTFIAERTTLLTSLRQAYDDEEHMETPYVVKMHRVAPLAATQDVFTFVHPNADAVIDNTRYARLAFDRTGQPAALCHGFAGYFDSQVQRPCWTYRACVAACCCPEVATCGAAYQRCVAEPARAGALAPG